LGARGDRPGFRAFRFPPRRTPGTTPAVPRVSGRTPSRRTRNRPVPDPRPPARSANMATKNKTNKSVKKRVKVTGSGKIKYTKVGRRHLNAHMTGKRKRQLRRPGVIEGRPSVLKKYKIALGLL